MILNNHAEAKASKRVIFQVLYRSPCCRSQLLQERDEDAEPPALPGAAAHGVRDAAPLHAHPPAPPPALLPSFPALSCSGKDLAKRSDLHRCLRWPLRQSSCCVRALQMRAQLLREANATATRSPRPSGASRLARAAASRPTAASTLVPGKQKHFLFHIAVNQEATWFTQVRLEGFLRMHLTFSILLLELPQRVYFLCRDQKCK